MTRSKANLISLAWRNLWRRKRRTYITAFSIGFGVMLAVTFTGTGDYSYTNMINAGADTGMGHISVQPAGYQQRPALDKRLVNTTSLQSEIMSIPGVQRAVIRIMGQAIFASARKSVGGAFIAIDPANESAEHNLFIRSLVEGKLFKDKNSGGVVVGSKLAEKLGLRLGKKMVYTTTDAQGEIVSEIARVSGIFKTGVAEIDGGLVLLPINRVRNTLNYQADEATLIAVNIEDQRRVQKLRDSIEQRVADHKNEVLDWKTTQPELASIIAMDRSSNYVSQVLVGLLIAAGILNTLLMSVMERRKEFGVMMAIGMQPASLFKLVVAESFWLALVGLLLGIIITTPWYLYLYYYGIDFSGAIGDDYSAGGVLIDPVMHIRLFRESVIYILTGVFALTLLSGLYPAWRATRTPPVESIKTL